MYISAIAELQIPTSPEFSVFCISPNYTVLYLQCSPNFFLIPVSQHVPLTTVIFYKYSGFFPLAVNEGLSRIHYMNSFKLKTSRKVNMVALILLHFTLSLFLFSSGPGNSF
jgi:hypothetical protein